MLSLMTIALLLGILFLIGKQATTWVWLISSALFFFILLRTEQLNVFALILFSMAFLLIGFLALTPLRIKFISHRVFKLIRQLTPAMSSTEREALEAGTVSWEGEIFSGSPDFKKLLNVPVVDLTPEEQAFINGPLKELCRLIDDWDITHVRTDLPPEVWRYIKEKGFLGMIIPKEYGGLEFSATAQVAILATVYGRSISCASTISVPNSLGPAELLLKYGTEEQKNYYLPRLARGEEIPCFALTGPNAGSDAAAIPDKGTVCYQVANGEKVLGIRLNWNKRYITLCPVATVIGLAFRLFDPDNLLGKGLDVGISCALIPAHLPGVIKGRRHFPLNTGFLNGPTQGKDVFIPLDYLIGGAAMAGCGWRMLMECLSAGRAISLPASAVGGSQAAARATGAYARIRKQFNQAIGKFEGIEEPLARIAGNTYLMDAGLMLAAASIDQGEKPSVAGAILKYHTTERARELVIDAMDIHGGKGICLGPNNYLGRGFQNCPISITVEGANILTRNLIIFGQGAIRCHPYVYQELESIRQNNLADFDKAFFGHVRFFLSNSVKSLLFSFTDGHALSLSFSTAAKRYYQLVYRYSTNLAFLADFCMITLGGDLKRKEKLSARLGDILSHLYLASAVLRRFHNEGEPESDLPLVEWTCQQLLYETEQAMNGIIANFPSRGGALVLKIILSPFGNRRKAPSDKLGKRLAQIMMTPSDTRQRLTRFVFLEPLENCPIGRLEQAFSTICSTEDLERTLHRLAKENKWQDLNSFEQIQQAEQEGLLTTQEIKQLWEAELARQATITVDDFSDDELRRSKAKRAAALV